MSNPIIRIHNIETNEVIDREMTDVEYAAMQAESIVAKEREKAKEAKEIARVELLERLGITAEEAALLLGGN